MKTGPARSADAAKGKLGGKGQSDRDGEPLRPRQNERDGRKGTWCCSPYGGAPGIHGCRGELVEQ